MRVGLAGACSSPTRSRAPTACSRDNASAAAWPHDAADGPQASATVSGHGAGDARDRPVSIRLVAHRERAARARQARRAAARAPPAAIARPMRAIVGEHAPRRRGSPRDERPRPRRSSRRQLAVAIGARAARGPAHIALASSCLDQSRQHRAQLARAPAPAATSPCRSARRSRRRSRGRTSSSISRSTITSRKAGGSSASAALSIVLLANCRSAASPAMGSSAAMSAALGRSPAASAQGLVERDHVARRAGAPEPPVADIANDRRAARA